MDEVQVAAELCQPRGLEGQLGEHPQGTGGSPEDTAVPQVQVCRCAGAERLTGT